MSAIRKLIEDERKRFDGDKKANAAEAELKALLVKVRTLELNLEATHRECASTLGELDSRDQADAKLQGAVAAYEAGGPTNDLVAEARVWAAKGGKAPEPQKCPDCGSADTFKHLRVWHCRVCEDSWVYGKAPEAEARPLLDLHDARCCDIGKVTGGEQHREGCPGKASEPKCPRCEGLGHKRGNPGAVCVVCGGTGKAGGK